MSKKKFSFSNAPSPEEVLENMRNSGEISDDIYQEINYQFEDIEDNHKLNDYEIYKKSYKNNRINKCVEVIIKIGNEKPSTFKKSFLLSDSLKNPINYKFDEIEYRKVMIILNAAIKTAKSKSMNQLFIDSLKDFYLYNYVFHNNINNNNNKLGQNPFSKFSLSKQLRMICIFIQDQNRLMSIQIQQPHDDGFMTGMEMEIANRVVDLAPKQKISLSDNYEGMLDYMDELIRYIYYEKKEDLKIDDTESHGNIHPFEIPSFEELIYIAHQKSMYSNLEENFRYMQCKINLHKNKSAQDVYVFSTENKDKIKAHLIAAVRRSHNYGTRFAQTTNMKKYKTVMDRVDDIARRLDVDEPEQFELSIEEFEELKFLVQPMIQTYKDLTKKYYFECSFNKIKVDDILSAYEFLYIYSQIYIIATSKKFNQEDYDTYKYLVPIISIEYLTHHFSRLNGIQKDKALKIIKNFTYDKNITKSDGDIFTRPLIMINQGKVLLCHTLIEHTNLDRSIEKLLQKYNVDLAPVGIEYEEELINQLKDIESIQVNTNHIEFLAYDEKNVQFDFIGTLENHLLLFEFKSMLTPYDDNEVYKREQVIKEGVAQVKRRCEIIKYDWDKIREMVNIKLPENPYSEDKIIKVVCSNIFDFTTLKMDGILLTDSSTLLKYFTNPIVTVFSNGLDGIKVYDTELIWKEGKPTVKEFLNYLDSPVTVGNISNCFQEELKYIPIFEGDFCIGFTDFILAEDPFRKDIQNRMQKGKNGNGIKNKKIYPNDPCPCRSGEKYKKCCGK